MSKASRIIAEFEARRRAKAQANVQVRASEPATDWDDSAAFIARLEAMEDDNFSPDPIGRINYEPKSIYSPAPTPRIQREAPRKRQPRDPYDQGRDCQLPDDKRRTRTLTFVNDRDQPIGRVTMNQHARKMAVVHLGLRNASSLPRKG